MRVLIIEDEEKTADYLRRGLTEQGYAVDVARAVIARHNADIAIGVYANAFPPQPKEAKANDGLDELREDLDPPGYLVWAKGWRERGANMIGGCCGIGPEHIAELKRHLA